PPLTMESGGPMATERQIAANRRNALKSTGPRTPEGKARSSRNAVKHGAYARSLPLTPEDRAAIRAALAAYRAELRTAGPLHRALPPQIAFQLALAEWGARIQLRAQTRLLTESIHDLQQAGHPAPDVQATVQNLSALNYLSRLEARFHRLQSRALNDL